MNIAPISVPNTMMPAQAATQKTRRPATCEVVERVRRPALAEHERDAGGDGDRGEPEHQGALVRDRPRS